MDGNFPVTNLGDEFRFMGTGYWLGVPMPVWISAVVRVDIRFRDTRRTRFGRYLYAVGGNERAAMLSGVEVDRIKRTVYMLRRRWPGLLVCSSPRDWMPPTPKWHRRRTRLDRRRRDRWHIAFRRPRLHLGNGPWLLDYWRLKQWSGVARRLARLAICR